MNITKASGQSNVYVNGQLVDSKGFTSQSDGKTLDYKLQNNNEFIEGEISTSKLDESDLLKLITVSKNKKSLIERLEDEFDFSDNFENQIDTPSKKERKTKKKKSKKLGKKLGKKSKRNKK
tara:strand:+ start:346 stop:708 length:363 start_codon:yes stop_codon:yes gene_type:complete